MTAVPYRTGCVSTHELSVTGCNCASYLPLKSGGINVTHFSQAHNNGYTSCITLNRRTQTINVCHPQP
jgi:hypothetical protein